MRPSLHDGSYRPDIDGLRAIAIVSVVLFHAVPSILPGGYVGVDIFFVISGYLISGILLKELRDRRFSVAAFYGRRIRRLFPALTIVLATCLCLGWFFLFSDEYTQLGKHVVSAALFLSNFVLRIEAGYFDVSAELKPLLHLWSLAVEEQFYLVWPAILALSFRFRLVAAMTICIFVLSFGYNVVRTFNAPISVFYLPQGRFWEFIVGCWLAQLTLSPPPVISVFLQSKTFQNIKALLPWAGASMILASFFLLDKASAFPGWWALLPVFGAGFLIAAGPDTQFNRTVLASRVFVAVGLISYPLYLWHWPLLSFARIHFSGAIPTFVIVLILLVSVLLSWLTYRFCELPIRSLPLRRVVPALIVVMAVVAAVGAAVNLNQGFVARAANARPDFDLDRLDGLHATAVRSGTCHLNEPTQNIDTIRKDAAGCFGVQANKSNILVIGDSHAGDLWASLSQAFPQHNFLQATGAGCNPGEESSREFPVLCRGLLRFLRQELLVARRFDGIIIFARWKPSYRNIIPDALRYQSLGMPVLVVGPTFEFLADVPKIVARRSPSDDLNRALSDRLNVERFKLDSEMRLEFERAGLRYFSLLNALCEKKVCPVFSETRQLYIRDYGHWTVHGIAEFGRVFVRQNLIDKLTSSRR